MSIIVNSAIHYTCAPDWSFSRQWDDHTLWYVTQGGCVVTESGEDHLCTAESCVVFSPGALYHGRHLPEKVLSVSVIHFDIKQLPFGLETSREYRAANPLVVRDLIQRAIRNAALGQMDASSDWLMASLRALREDDDISPSTGRKQASEHAERIDRLCRVIADDPAVTYRIEDLARDAFVSPDHFRRLFKERTGITPKAWIIRCRIQKAKGLLLGSDYTIERIAELCGFQNVFFFSRQFKEKAGIPPSVYRA